MNAPSQSDPQASGLADIARRRIRAAARRSEDACVAELAADYAAGAPERAAVEQFARRLVEALRQARQHAGGVDQLMHEFPLNSREGVLLMGVAEALLRIPDDATADRLLRDKLPRGDWRAHAGHSASPLVNMASRSLALAGELMAGGAGAAFIDTAHPRLGRIADPLIRAAVAHAMKWLGRQFVMAETIEQALQRSQAAAARGYGHSFDMLGEGALSAADAERYCAAYEHAIRALGQVAGGRGVIAAPGISLKLSALHPRYSPLQSARLRAELWPRLRHLAGLARQAGIGLNIDAEEAERLEPSLDLFEMLVADPALAGWDGLGFVVQAYQKRALAVVDHLAGLARASERRLMVRLVKGAYWDSEIKKAQQDGLADYPVFTRKSHTDLSYLACARRLLAAADCLYPQFATHNAHTLAAVHEMARASGVEDYEFQCLHGMGEPLYDQLVGPAGQGRRCRIYAPVGSHRTLLPYLVRRLLENGANTSFVNRLVDEQVSIDELLADPLLAARADGGDRHGRIPRPGELFGSERINSAGLDLADPLARAELAGALGGLAGEYWHAGPTVCGREAAGERRPVRNPARPEEIVGEVCETNAATVAAAVSTAVIYAPSWHGVAPAERARCLLRAADLLEAERPRLVSLCLREAGKTWGDALAEVREAVDFCRYYAAQLLTLPDEAMRQIPGPVACISPWNFPLAIFVGQVAAALAAGSPVLAKPAEQTPLIAALATELLHRAGIPPAALQLLPGQGETVGAALVADARVRGVMFTGSGAVAHAIAGVLSWRPPGTAARLIAETGGRNVMVVDASALPEQVVQDVLSSGFGSAGQRCSALRILCLQEEIAEPVLAMLRGAMAELLVGDPADAACDVGPLIDRAAQDHVLAHIAHLRRDGHRIVQAPLAASAAAGTFVPPTLIEIDGLDTVREEVFGPVVHVLRFAGERLPALLDAINAAGYGLTAGLHSRIEATHELAAARCRAGNLYINRSMIGAVVGVQPFGGEGLSGTGPKAGGPLYLRRLVGQENVRPAELGLSVLAAPLAPPPALAELAAWAVAQGEPALAAACAEYAEASLWGWRFALPGPTGERNTLHFVPRGRALCLAAHRSSALEQVAACLAAGCRPLLPAGSGLADLGLPLSVREQIQPWTGEGRPELVLVDGDTPDYRAQVRRLVERPGPILPVLRLGVDSGRYAVYRLLNERVVTVNTAAAGGNAELMSL